MINHSTEITDNSKRTERNMIINALLLVLEAIVVIFKITWEIILAIVGLFIPIPRKPVKGEIVLITGTGHGLGRELALQYASNGATVVCLDVNKDNNEETVAMINNLGYSKAYAYTCNVSDYAEVHAVVDRIHKEVGEVTILINNAGIMPTHLFENHTKEQIEQIMNVNVLGYHWTIKEILPTMLKNNRGHIVAVSSVAGVLGLPNLVPYCASKFAVRGLMTGLRRELDFYKHTEIKTTTIYPYIIDTGLAKKPIIRFPNLTPIVKTCDAAKTIMDFQRKDVLEGTIPREFTIVCKILGMLPYKAEKIVCDFMETYIESE